MFSYKGIIDITCKNSRLTASARLNLIIPAKWDGFDGRTNPHIIDLTKYLNNTPSSVINIIFLTSKDETLANLQTGEE